MKSDASHKALIALMAVLSFAAAATAQYDAEKFFAFLRDTYNRHDKNLYDFLIRELDDYTDMFPDDKNAAEAYFLRATIYEAKGDGHEALASFFKTLFLHPNSSPHEACANAARRIISTEKAFAQQKEKLLARVEGQFGGATAADRHYDFLSFLMGMGIPALNRWTFEETNGFVSRFPDDTRLDMVLRWIADLRAKRGEPREAAVSYLKLDYICPQSPLLLYSRFNRAVILYKELGENEKAIEVFGQIAATYPDSDYAGASFFMLGEIKQKKLKDYKGAVADYRKMADSYPKNAKVVDALFAIAEMQTDKLAAPAEAIAVYDEIVAKHASDERSIKALERAGDLSRTKLDDFAKAAQYYARIAEIHPNYEKAPEMLLKAGALCEDKLKDYAKAIEYYKIVSTKFPDHRLAREAKRRIAKAEERSQH